MLGHASFPFPKLAVWAVAALVPTAWVWASFSFYDTLLASGTLPPDGDSIAIPIAGDIAIATAVSPIIAGCTYFALKRYDGLIRPFAWRSDRTTASLLFSALFLVPACFQFVTFAPDWFRPMPIYERYWDAAIAAQLAWLLVMRAIVVEGLNRDGDLSDS